MKRNAITTICIILAICLCTHSVARNPLDELSQDERRTYENALMLIDGGMAEAAIEDFDNLLRRHPDNYLVIYERMYALYHLGRFDEINKGSKKLLNHPDVDALAFQMCGNVADITGKSKQAEKIYRKGLAKFPKSGPLHLELGNLRMARQKYNEALGWYLDGIVADPNFPSNYYRTALLSSLCAETRIWTLVLAETEILLAPGHTTRHTEMSQLIRECLLNNIHIESSDSSWMAQVTLVPERGISIDQAINNVRLSFEGVYECCTAASAVRLIAAGDTTFNGSIRQMAELRKGIAEFYHNDCDDLYGDSMHLLQFHKHVIDAGYWEAYNYFLFSKVLPEEFDEWFGENSRKFDEFADWYNDDKFRLGQGRSVDPHQIFNNYKPIDLVKALTILDLPQRKQAPDAATPPQADCEDTRY